MEALASALGRARLLLDTGEVVAAALDRLAIVVALRGGEVGATAVACSTDGRKLSVKRVASSCL